MKVVVTGTAGFIGYHLAEKLIQEGHEVIGVDCVTDYYDVNLKEARIGRLKRHQSFLEVRHDIADVSAMRALFATHRPSHAVNLAAQAGVRYSLKNPEAYLKSNIDGFLGILEACRFQPVSHLVFASTSSVYGASVRMPLSEHDSAEHPLTLYAATKKANEMMAHSYAHLFGFPVTGVRFFTVYGPWGRPDMALFAFTKAILGGRPIDVFNHGDMKRDFTYIDDTVEGIFRLLQVVPESIQKETDPAASAIAPYRLLNIGRSQPELLNRYIEVLEEKLGRKAKKNMLPMQPGDVPATWADTHDLEQLTGYKPATSIEEGVGRFVDWYLEYYNVKL